MRKKMRVLASICAFTLAISLLSACGSSNDAKSGEQANGGKGGKDTITALLPPVSGKFQDNFKQMEKEFSELYPDLTLKIEPASWEDVTQKLDTQVNAGSPPDIAFIPSAGIPKYIQQGMLMDMTDVATPEMVADYDKIPLEYMKSGNGLYGFPAYMEVHALGGNREFLEKAGIDWKKVQQDGWTFDEFREAVKKGVVKEGDKTSRYGFVFATAGVASKDYLGILVKNAGMPAQFDKDMKYAYTSKNFLEVLKDIRVLIDDGSMPKELSSVDAGKRWNMFLTGQTMITGKGLATFENNSKENNEKIAKKDGSEVKGSIPVEYTVLPVPTFLGQEQKSAVAVDGYVTFRGKNEPTAEHKANVVKAAYFLASGKVAATTNNDLFAAHITASAKKEAEKMPIQRDEFNEKAVETLLSHATPARPDIPADLAAKAIKLETEVIVPKLQALIANEITPEKMFDAVKEAAISTFGEDGIVKD